MPQARLLRFAKLLKNERNKLDLNRTAFCELVGISRTTLRLLENGSQQPTQETIDKVAKALGLTHAMLTGLDPQDPDPLLKDLRPEDLRLANQFHHAGAEAKHAMKCFLSTDVSDEHRERVAVVLERLLRYRDILDAVEAMVAGHDQDQRTAATPATVPPPAAAPATQEKRKRH